jgi:chromate transporter
MGMAGLISFGGPQSHVAMLQRMCVEERKWMTHETFAELFGLCSSIPGATSSQLCFALGIARLGVLAGLASYVLFCWVGFVALLLMATLTRTLVIPWYLQGLEVGASCAALALVALAALNLALSLCVTRFTMAVAFTACVVCLALPFWFIYSLVIVLSGLGALLYYRYFPAPEPPRAAPPIELCAYPKWAGVLYLLSFVVVFGVLLLMRFLFPSVVFLQVVETFFRVGSFVVGGGQVVLPMIDHELVGVMVGSPPRPILDEQSFFDGFAAVSLVPGPMFSFSVFYGARIGGPLLGCAAWFALNAPGFLFLLAALPFFSQVHGCVATQIDLSRREREPFASVVSHTMQIPLLSQNFTFKIRILSFLKLTSTRSFARTPR